MDHQRTVLITGASGGIGRAAVEYFSAQGWMVVGTDRDLYEGKFPDSGVFISADVALQQGWDTIVNAVQEHPGRLDALVNNAAVQVTKPLLETTPEEWDQVMDTNLRAVFLGIKAVHHLLTKDGGGAVINVSSVHAVATSRDIASYAASKGGLLALTRAMALEFAEKGIRVNAVLPGAVDTRMLQAGLDREHAGEGSIEERLQKLAERTVNGRVGQPGEIARAIYFLADEDQSSFITGTPIIIDGGASARLSTE